MNFEIGQIPSVTVKIEQANIEIEQAKSQVQTVNNQQISAKVEEEYLEVKPVHKDSNTSTHDSVTIRISQLAKKIELQKQKKKQKTATSQKQQLFRVYDIQIDQCSIFIENVNYNAKQQDLEEFFEDCGQVKKVTILRDFKKVSKGMAYVQFADVKSADRAVSLSGGIFFKRRITIGKKRMNKPGFKPQKKVKTQLQLLQDLMAGAKAGQKTKLFIQSKKQLSKYFNNPNNKIKKIKKQGK